MTSLKYLVKVSIEAIPISPPDTTENKIKLDHINVDLSIMAHSVQRKTEEALALIKTLNHDRSLTRVEGINAPGIGIPINIGRYSISNHFDGKKHSLWIDINGRDSDYAGEGGEFNIREFEEIIDKFYKDNF